jgi:effector-binding domain-containing protein
VLILRPQAEVFDYLNDLQNFNSWSPWYRKDSLAHYTFSGPTVGKGATFSWESVNSEVGKGSLSISSSSPDSVIQLKLGFGKSSTALSEFKIVSSGEATEVNWKLSVQPGANPFFRILSSFMENRVGADFEEGLNNLKLNLEKNAPRQNAVLLVEKVQLPLTYYLYVKDKAAAKDIAAVLSLDFAKISNEIKKQGLTIAGAPFVIYNSPGPDFEMDIALPVGTPGQTSSEIKSATMNAGKALIARYFGPYDQTRKAHEAIDAYAKANQLVISGAPWETYITDPIAEKDTAKWETDVYYPIK